MPYRGWVQPIEPGTEIKGMLYLFDVEYRPTKTGRSRMSKFLCHCGRIFDGITTSIFTGKNQSCGCHRREVGRLSLIGNSYGKTHGQTDSPTYGIWMAMRHRCKGHGSEETRRNYLDRGIRVCERWDSSFQNFLADMGPRPGKLTIERIKNDKGYEPGNCRWATMREQAQNNRRNVFANWKGEMLCISEISRRSGFDHRVISRRLKKGLSPTP